MSVPSTVSRRGRAASQSDLDAGPPAQRRRLAAVTPVEDPSFNSMDYRVCFLRVEDHLFQIHLFHLLRDPHSVFRDMLSMPTGGTSPEGFDRSSPVILSGDSLAQVRAFHQMVYASPMNSQTSAFRAADLQMLVDAGLFAHKYSINDIVSLTLAAILQIGQRCSFDSTSPELTTAILRLTSLRGPSDYNRAESSSHGIRDLVRRSFMLRIQANASYQNLREMLDEAEKYDLRPLLGEVYHLYLLKISTDREANHEPDPSRFPDPSLSELHRGRIMTGNWSLEDCWQRLAENPPPVPGRFCNHPTQHETWCLPQWQAAWRAATDARTVRTIRSLDIFEKLAALHGCIEGTYENPQFCFRRAFRGLHPVSEYSRKLRESLADHFMGPL
ncbi:hypothetical protein C8R47DRAFT_1329799 [Mycena vitilis]|nr:hypothetical protein C8R47DRAFT_1329799 [Mycena vitilis]